MWARILCLLVWIGGMHYEAYGQRPFPFPNHPDKNKEECPSTLKPSEQCKDQGGGGSTEIVTLASLVYVGQRWVKCWIFQPVSGSGNVGVGNYGSMGGSVSTYVLIEGRWLYDVEACVGPGTTCILGSVKLTPATACEPVRT